jgi:hypothetical protein
MWGRKRKRSRRRSWGGGCRRDVNGNSRDSVILAQPITGDKESDIVFGC